MCVSGTCVAWFMLCYGQWLMCVWDVCCDMCVAWIIMCDGQWVMCIGDVHWRCVLEMCVVRCMIYFVMHVFCAVWFEVCYIGQLSMSDKPIFQEHDWHTGGTSQSYHDEWESSCNLWCSVWTWPETLHGGLGFLASQGSEAQQSFWSESHMVHQD